MSAEVAPYRQPLVAVIFCLCRPLRRQARVPVRRAPVLTLTRVRFTGALRAAFADLARGVAASPALPHLGDLAFSASPPGDALACGAKALGTPYVMPPHANYIALFAAILRPRQVPTSSSLTLGTPSAASSASHSVHVLMVCLLPATAQHRALPRTTTVPFRAAFPHLSPQALVEHPNNLTHHITVAANSNPLRLHCTGFSALCKLPNRTRTVCFVAGLSN